MLRSLSKLDNLVYSLVSVQKHLIIFTRYPEPGKAKTRLIPVLGAQGAADLHRRMTEHTIAQARTTKSDCIVSVYFTGGTVEQMQHWLGHDLQYHPQHSGDLGDRLIAAFQTAFAQGALSVITIGTDCPAMTSELLTTAFDRLNHHDLTIGAALDGGYYLIGLRRCIPELFRGIAWSTDVVFQQTLTIAKQLELSIFNLPVLNDIDRPEDLADLKEWI